jgi:hypothetical protein
MKRLLAAAAVLATIAHGACAGELTLFADSDFRGTRATVTRDARDLNEFGFNDRASSMVIRSGTWLLCEHRDFGGYCAEFGPGEYRQLPNFNDAVSSAREITRGGRGDHRSDERGGNWGNNGNNGRRDEYRDNNRDNYRDERGGRDAVMLFSGPRFEGTQVALVGDVRSLEQAGFNDRAGSLVIRAGRWEFCEHADFHGQCVVYGPGEYPFLNQMNNRISSMRRVR